ncbi:SLC13 family permease [Actinosynnema pretiosum subsp. pretiosum]|uniref:SLC13 family permease n=1 Tax=Actinosynnema pretiosum subsp. pretiosum TaxID=103721 RepID=A0AA45L577_9PSEU|nr:integral membrane transporter [Actinosynnema pretiosum subsp. pretiosum]QUF03704.1 SLC13 family permease [Actinosynnema pretiosum subsp. pretiosum]
MDTFTYTTRPEQATVPLARPEPPRRRPRAHLALALAALAVLAAALPADGLHWRGAVVLAVFTGAVGAWVFTKVDDTWIALVAVSLLAASGVVEADEVFATLGADLVWLLIAAFVLAAGLTRSGLVERFTAALLNRARTPRQLAHLTTLALVGSSLAVPSTSGRAALALPVFTSLAKAVPPRLARALSLLFPTVVLLSAVSTLIGAGAHLIADQLLADATGDGIGFLHWLLLGLPLAVLSCHLAAELTLLLFTRRQDRRTRLSLDLPAPPKTWSKPEKHAAATTAAVLALWCAEPLHGAPPALVGLLGALVITVPPHGEHRVTPGAALKTVPWSLLLFTAATAALGDALVTTGAAQWLADHALAPLRHATPEHFLVAVVLVGTAAHLAVQSRSARSSVLVPVVIPLALAAGVNPALAVFASTAAAGFCHTLTSSAKPVALFADVEGVPTYSARDLLRLSAALAPLHVAVVSAFALLVWPASGLPISL